jgi:hypothetical protein
LSKGRVSDGAWQGNALPVILRLLWDGGQYLMLKTWRASEMVHPWKRSLLYRAAVGFERWGIRLRPAATSRRGLPPELAFLI